MHTNSSDRDVTLSQLTLIKWRDGNGQEEELRLLEDMAPSWKQIGGLVGISDDRLFYYERQCFNDTMQCIRQVVRDWMKMCSRKVRSD